ncbi:MAG: hypothetical protein RL489_2132 [Pseudomonadota bacterium]|jgi:hypothetical protein
MFCQTAILAFLSWTIAMVAVRGIKAMLKADGVSA